MCLKEKIHVLDELCSCVFMNYGTIGHEFNGNESTT